MWTQRWRFRRKWRRTVGVEREPPRGAPSRPQPHPTAWSALVSLGLLVDFPHKLRQHLSYHRGVLLERAWGQAEDKASAALIGLESGLLKALAHRISPSLLHHDVQMLLTRLENDEVSSAGAVREPDVRSSLVRLISTWRKLVDHLHQLVCEVDQRLGRATDPVLPCGDDALFFS